jgi:hypothetical protein
LNLLRKDVISDLFSGLANVWSSAEHTLVRHDTYSEVINTSGVINSAHDLWSHISWGTGRILGVLWSPDSCNTEISNPEISNFVNDQVLRLDVSMDDILFMAFFQASNEASTPKLYMKKQF